MLTGNRSLLFLHYCKCTVSQKSRPMKHVGKTLSKQAG